MRGVGDLAEPGLVLSLPHISAPIAVRRPGRGAVRVSTHGGVPVSLGGQDAAPGARVGTPPPTRRPKPMTRTDARPGGADS